MKKREYKDGEPCRHKGCLNHISHPCEGCGRIAGKNTKEMKEVKEAIKIMNKLSDDFDLKVTEAEMGALAMVFFELREDRKDGDFE